MLVMKCLGIVVKWSRTLALGDRLFVFEEFVDDLVYLIRSNAQLLNVFTSLLRSLDALKNFLMWLFAICQAIGRHAIVYWFRHWYVVWAEHEFGSLLVFCKRIDLILKISCYQTYMFRFDFFTLTFPLRKKLVLVYQCVLAL